MWMRPHRLGYPSIWECIPWGTPVYGDAFPTGGTPVCGSTFPDRWEYVTKHEIYMFLPLCLGRSTGHAFTRRIHVHVALQFQMLFNFRSSPPMATAHNKTRDVKKTLADRDVQHWLRHQSKTCLRCKYAKRVRFWQKLTVISELRTSWLEGQKDKDGNWFLGCKACARNSVDTVFGQHRVTKLAKFTILQHSGKLSHQESVAKMTGVPFERKVAPPRKH